MATYAVMVVLDLDVEVLDGTEVSEVENITKNTVRMRLEDGERRVRIKILRTKLLGLSKDNP